MKKALLLLAMFAIVSNASAQSYKNFRMGPKIGVNVSGMTGSAAGDLKYKAGFIVGLASEYSLNNWFALSADLLYSQQGGRVKINDAVVKENLNYLNIPIMANFYVTDKFALKAGIQPGFNISARDKIKYDDKIDITKIGDEISVFYFSIPIGVSYDFLNSFRVEARYNFGVSNVYKHKEPWYPKGVHSVFTITVGWML